MSYTDLLRGYLDGQGLLRLYPTKESIKVHARRFLAGRLQYGRDYTEREVSAALDANHTFGDSALLRRELVEHELLARTRDGRRYWRTSFASLPATWPMPSPLTAVPADDSDRQFLSRLRLAGTVCPWQPDAALGAAESADLSDELLVRWAVRDERDSSTVAIIGVHHGWPHPWQLAIAELAMVPDRRELLVAVLAALAGEARQSPDYRTIVVGLCPTAWPERRQWLALGFDTLLRIDEAVEPQFVLMEASISGTASGG